MIVTKMLILPSKLQIHFNFVLKLYASKFAATIIEIKVQGV